MARARQAGCGQQRQVAGRLITGAAQAGCWPVQAALRPTTVLTAAEAGSAAAGTEAAGCPGSAAAQELRGQGWAACRGTALPGSGCAAQPCLERHPAKEGWPCPVPHIAAILGGAVIATSGGCVPSLAGV